MSTQASVVAEPAGKPRTLKAPPRSRARARREARAGWALIAPALAVVGVFILYPLAYGVYISFTNWPLVGPYHYVGLANYRSILHNSTFTDSIWFTLKYTAIVTPPILVVGYALAVFVRSNRVGSTFFRTCFFLPFIIGLTTLSFLLEVELQPGFGTVNVLLSHLGIEGINTPWTADTNLALTAICIFVIWFASGLTMMLLMAGMQSIPEQLYESADVDGASWWQQERMITIPLLRRSIALSLVISVVGSLLAFNQFFIITDGGPGSSTQSVVMQIYETFNSSFDIGTASAMSIVVILVVGFITFIQIRFLRSDDV
jgi:multiple sugar transport system permease protein